MPTCAAEQTAPTARKVAAISITTPAGYIGLCFLFFVLIISLGRACLRAGDAIARRADLRWAAHTHRAGAAAAVRGALLILDEPTVHLDPELGVRVMAKLLDVCDDRGLLVITHDVAALEGFDRVLRLQHGSIASHDARRSALALA